MSLFHWSEKYHTKIKSIDDQHKHLFDIANDLHNDITSGAKAELLKAALAGLLKYTSDHLTYEESLLKQNGYPDFDAHKKQHDHFTETIRKYDNALKSGSKVEELEILGTVIDWLQNHILETDFGYKEFLIGKGVK